VLTARGSGHARGVSSPPRRGSGEPAVVLADRVWLQKSTSPGRKVPGPSSATEGVLVRRTPPTFDEVTVETDLTPRGDGDVAALVEREAGSAAGRDRGRQRPGSQSRRAVDNAAAGRCSAEEPLDRGSARTALDHVSSPLRGAGGRSRQRLKREVRRQAKLHLDDSSVTRTEGFPETLRRPAQAHGEPVLEARETSFDGSRQRARPGIERSEGARAGSRLQTSVRRIFLVTRGEREIARGDHPAFAEAGPGSQRTTGCGAEHVHAKSAHGRACSGCEARVDPREGVLVRPVTVVLTRRQHLGPGAQTVGGAGRSPRRRPRRATEDTSSSHVRPRFPSRWAREVSGRRPSPAEIAVPRRYDAGESCHGEKPWCSGLGSGSANCPPSPREPTT